MDLPQFCSEVLLVERQWSWAVIGIVYLVLTVVIRQLFFRPLVREAKEVDPAIYPVVRGLYLKKSLTGWILYAGSFFLALAAWMNFDLILKEKTLSVLFCFLLPLLYLLSVIFHIQAFSGALLAALRQRMGVEKEF